MHGDHVRIDYANVAGRKCLFRKPCVTIHPAALKDYYTPANKVNYVYESRAAFRDIRPQKKRNIDAPDDMSGFVLRKIIM